MSLLPYLMDDSSLWRHPHPQRDWLSPMEEDFFQPIAVPRIARRFNNYMRNLETALQDTSASITCDKNKFQVNFDVQHFKPQEISVKMSDDKTITIEGEHEEKRDEHGHIYRHFVRKYTLPDNCDVGRVESKLSSDGVLTISAPRNEEKISSGISVPITQTGKPAKSIEQKME